MDREHVKGTAEKVNGTIKDTAGKVTDDKNYRRKVSSTKLRAQRTRSRVMSKTR